MIHGFLSWSLLDSYFDLSMIKHRKMASVYETVKRGYSKSAAKSLVFACDFQR